MVALSSITQGAPVVAGGRTASRTDADGGFAQTLATLTGGDDGDAPPQPLTSPAQRQDAADDGKTLPDPAADPAAPATLDPRLLWLPAGLLPIAPTVPALPAATLAPQPVAASALATADPLATPVATDTDGAKIEDTAKSSAKVASGDSAIPNTLADLFHAVGRIAAPDAMPVQTQPQPASSITATVSPEVAALGLDPTVRDERKKITADPIPQPTTMTTEVALRNAVQPTGETRHVPLDLRGDTGLQKMIDHIETLRDGADANDTRIRLVPDALGTVDVAVRRDGDAVHVHFTAETAATRTLLTEAQPRLAELAEQRGVRIAGASVDAGSGGSGGHAQPQSQSQRQPQAVTTKITTTTIEATGDDARLA